jgi:hypothetical protein
MMTGLYRILELVGAPLTAAAPDAERRPEPSSRGA